MVASRSTHRQFESNEEIPFAAEIYMFPELVVHKIYYYYYFPVLERKNREDYLKGFFFLLFFITLSRNTLGERVANTIFIFPRNGVFTKIF